MKFSKVLLQNKNELILFNRSIYRSRIKMIKMKNQSEQLICYAFIWNFFDTTQTNREKTRKQQS